MIVSEVWAKDTLWPRTTRTYELVMLPQVGEKQRKKEKGGVVGWLTTDTYVLDQAFVFEVEERLGSLDDD